jgi:ketosteroid isomerase-like protein
MSHPMDNKRLMQDIFSELSQGNFQPFCDAMAEDIEWTWMGTMKWSRTFKGKKAVVHDLFGAVKTTLAAPYKDVAHRFIADGDYVVVEHGGENKTPDGRPYNNRYCWVCRFADGKLHELHEYMDTALVTATFSGDGES